MKNTLSLVHFCVAVNLRPLAGVLLSSAQLLTLKNSAMAEDDSSIQPAPAAFKADVWQYFGFRKKE